MDQFFRYHRQMLYVLCGVCALAAAALAAFPPGDTARLWGFVAGAAAQLLKFGVVDASTIRRIAAGTGDAARIQLRSTFLSLAVFAAAVAATLHFSLDVWTMAAGIFLPRVVLLADAFIRPNPFRDAAGNDGPEKP